MAVLQKFDKTIVLRFMRDALRKITEAEPRHSQLMGMTIQLLAEAGLYERRRQDFHQEFCSLKPGGPNKLLVSLAEAFQHLITFGYIIPKPSPPNAPKADWIIVTDAGRQWAEGIDPAPDDTTGYLGALNSLVTNLDSVIVQYVQEALIAYERRAFFASAVMIGAASEKAVYLLMEALHNAVQNPTEKAAIQNAIDRRGLPTMFTRIYENLEKAKTSNLIPYPVHEGADNHLLSLQEMIRVQRNDAVHPVAAKVTPETLRLTLSAFPYACRKIYDLIDWLNNNQI